jgi:hypothetical protein
VSQKAGLVFVIPQVGWRDAITLIDRGDRGAGLRGTVVPSTTVPRISDSIPRVTTRD